ncbi:MAG: hypothetical protein KTR20_03385 [Cellvibrionaceae bacterium]|nr:hypothetical protein [Cellvibrionaceae bacterium]
MKTSTKAALLSGLVFPGSGQVYLKHTIRGLCFGLIAGIGLYLILAATIELANSIAANIVSGKMTLDVMVIRALIQESMGIYQQPPLLMAKIAITAAWVWSTIDAYYLGKKPSPINAQTQ